MASNLAIYQSNSGSIEFRTDFNNNTLWATQFQIGELFCIDQSRVSRHIKNIFKDGEVNQKSNMRKTHNASSDKPISEYSLDIIFAVGYRTNSKNAIKFRKWATDILHKHLVHGYTINQRRLTQLNKAIEIISRSEITEIAGVANILQSYTAGLNLLDNYDHQTLKKPRGKKARWQLSYDSARALIDEMKFSENSSLFGNAGDDVFKGILLNIYQTFDGQELYSSLQEKAANLLYLLVKDHPFIDGNKRIAAALFVYFLNQNEALYDKAGKRRIDNNTLAAVTLMVALSHPNEKDEIILVIMNLLN